MFDEKKNLSKQYASIENINENKNKIFIKSDYKTYIQETKVDYIETESIRNEECTRKLYLILVISEGNVNEVYSNNYNSNVNMNRITKKINEEVEIAVPYKLKQIFNNRISHQIKGKK